MIGPALPELVRWIAEMPPAFRASGDQIRPRAVVADLFESLFGDCPTPATLAAFEVAADSVAERNRLAWVLAACHALWHPALRAGQTGAAPRVEKLLVQELAALAAVVPVATLDGDEERREELARRVMRAAGLRLPGESERDSEDRLRQVDSIERRKVLAAAAVREKRAREVREAMARKAAEEAAAKVSRE